MRRLRILAAILGCFAALATGMPVFATVSAPTVGSDLSISGVPAPCDHCPDCDSGSCARMVDCTAPCATSIPTLGVATIELPSVDIGHAVRPAHLTTLEGELTPPDPFPPRL